jgi:hypothetical protein
MDVADHRAHAHGGRGAGTLELVRPALDDRVLASRSEERVPYRGASVWRTGAFRARDFTVCRHRRILYATKLARLEAQLSCEVLLPRLEWQALYCRIHGTADPPERPPSLNEAIAWVAKLGGHLGRKHDRPPGPTVLWRGFLALHEITLMFRIFRHNE